MRNAVPQSSPPLSPGSKTIPAAESTDTVTEIPACRALVEAGGQTGYRSVGETEPLRSAFAPCLPAEFDFTLSLT